MDYVDLAEPGIDDICPRCNGEGFVVYPEMRLGGVYDEREVSCTRCHGTGQITVAGTNGPYGDDPDHEEWCPKCNAETDEFMDEAELSPF